MNNSENMEYRKYTHNFTHSLCKCRYYEISEYTNLNFGDREKGMNNLQHNGQGLPEEGLTLPWAGRVPSQAAPAHPLQGTAGCENEFKKRQRNATKTEEEEKHVRNASADSNVRQEREGMGCPECQSRDSPALTFAEQRGFPAGTEVQGKPTLQQD